MKERPILWSAPMVLALLARRKTQTRRVAKFKLFDGQNPDFSGYTPGCYHSDIAASGYVLRSRGAGGCWNDRTKPLKPYALVGDRLWGRETWAWVGEYHFHDHRSIMWRATSGDSRPLDGRWRPSIFMPRWASRLLDEVVGVRVERLQDISEPDAIAEGIEDRGRLSLSGQRWCWPGGNEAFTTARAAYLAGWDTINGEGSAAKNPWVWVIEFRSL
jgi:hypothetical protein